MPGDGDGRRGPANEAAGSAGKRYGVVPSPDTGGLAVCRRLTLLLVLLLLPAAGCLYAHYRTPLDTNLENTRLGDKVGTSERRAILWLFLWGDAGTSAAARNGGLRVIHHADREVLSVLFGLYFRERLILYGE